MKPIIKIDLEQIINSDKPVILELGCGPNKKKERIGIDKFDSSYVDIVADLEYGLSFFPDDSVDEIHSTHFLEHIKNFENLMREIVRVLKKRGKSYTVVPHFSNSYFFSNPTHKNFFGLYTLYYFTERKYQLKRTVPTFYTDIRIKIILQKLAFWSPFKRRSLIKKAFGKFINMSSKLQEFYEENLCYIFPCYGLEIIFTPDK